MTVAIAVAALIGLLIGCQPREAVDETAVKNHQDTHRIEVTFTPGTIEGDRFTPDTSLPAITFTADETTQWQQSQPVQVRADIPYFVQLKHYGKKGDLLNGEYTTNGEDRIHQHFFIPVDYGDYDSPLDVIDYRYLDTDPWDAPFTTGAKVIGDKNPIGLKGVMRFKTAGLDFGIRVRLLHARGSKWNDKGEASPFYRPGNWTANGQYDLDLRMPIQVLNQ